MKIVGLITEYNPFHNGHLYHLQKSKEATGADYTVIVMSGNYVQRGEPAIVDKWTRTSMALRCGADLVIELPVVYATSSAEFFAFGAVSVLHNTGIVDSICFGSEHGNLMLLSQIAHFLCDESKDFQENLKKHLSQGVPFPTARTQALFNLLCERDVLKSDENEIKAFLSSPNNILGIEYLKALKTLGSCIKPYTIQRIKAPYHSTDIESSIASATAIRNTFKNKSVQDLSKAMPEESFDLFMKAVDLGTAPIYFDDFSLDLQYILRTTPEENLRLFREITEGLENRILEYASKNFLISDLAKAVKTKRYTLTRIQRALMNIVLQISSRDFGEFQNNGGPQYIRILGFRNTARPLLKELKQCSKLPIVSNFKKSYKEFKGLPKKMLEIESKSTDIYRLHAPNPSQRLIGTEFSSPLIILDQ
ncbi:MAG: nucleotidyltransferase [Epulopiscium sp.]|nr:nucleotidyltransferase [Candidatus Epulonipiscium sp.]